MLLFVKHIFFSFKNLNWLFLLLPILYLTVALLFEYFGGVSFPDDVDPEYAYLFNGITLAHLNPDLNCVGHPGTPVQCLIAIVAWVVHLFRPGQSLWDDVILNPELYIRATIYAANVTNTIILFLLGRKVYRFTGDPVAAIVLQVTPFAFLISLEMSYRLLPELIMTGIVSCWLMVLVKILYETPEVRNYKKYSLKFALLFGFSLADKLTFLPFFILPFIILPDWKFRLRYSLLSVLFFLIFAFPILFNFPKFVHWVTDIFTHKGVYGGGEKGIVDWNIFSGNMKLMILHTRQIMIPLILLIAMTIFYFIKRRKKDISVLVSSGVIALFIIHYLITAKHYAFYYLTPSFLLSVFTGFMIYVMLTRILPNPVHKILSKVLLSLFGLLLIINVMPQVFKQHKILNNRKNIKLEACKNVRPFLENGPKIICPYYYGCSSVEYALLFGLLESGRHGHANADQVRKHYPSTIFYLPWNNTFYNGVDEVKPSSFLTPASRSMLYIAGYSPELFNKVMLALQSDSVKFEMTTTKLYDSQKTAESVFSLSIETTSMNNWKWYNQNA